MHLSGLELHGFKSFPRKTKLTFIPGVMGIVGPNGCGKTNIVDSVRWVFGEQRTSILRSDKMENVIFAGTRSSKPMHMAEVTLTIENSHGVLPSEYSDISITRKLNRDGESEYLINKRPSRLKDIRTLFADTGLGPDSYSIIELKMVEDILSSRPDERRRLFEEAAGVTMYKARLHSARLKLSATDSDMVRFEDLMREVTSQRNSLKRQVSRAKRHRYLSEALRVRELTEATAEIADLRARLAPLEERLHADRRKRDVLSRELQQAEDELAGLRGSMTGLEEQVNDLRQANADLEGRSQASREEIVMLEERLREGEKRREERDLEERDLKKRREEITGEIEALDRKRGDAGIRAEEITLRLQGMDISWEEFKKREQKVQSRREDAESARREGEKRLAGLESESVQVDERLEQVLKRLAELENLGNDKAAPVDPEPLAGEVGKLTAELFAADAKVEEARGELERVREAMADARSESARASRDLEAAGRREKFLDSLVREGEGRSKAVKALMKSGMKDLAGRLGDAVAVEDEWKPAAAAALEGIASAIVAGSRSSLREAANFLLTKNIGRGLLIASEAGDESDPGKPVFAGKDGVVGPLLEHVKGKGSAGKAVTRWLKRVWIVDDLDSLLSLGVEAQTGGWTIVTRDGCRLTPDGLLSAGKVDPTDLGAIKLFEEARRERKAAAKRSAEAEKEVKRLQGAEESVRKSLEQANARRSDVGSELDSAREKHARADADYRAHRALADERVLESERLQNEVSELEGRRDAIASELEKLRQSAKRNEEQLNEVLEELRTVDEEGASLRSARDRLREEQIEASANLERVQGEVRMLGAHLDEITHRLGRIGEERGEASNAMEDAGERLRRVQAEEAVIVRDLRELRERLENAEREYNKVRHEFTERDSALSGKRSELQALSDRIHASDLEIAELSHRLASFHEKVLEEYSIDLFTSKQEELPLAFDEKNPYMESMNLTEVREALRDIGPVNQMALEEYEEVDQRYDRLIKEHADLVEAEETLQKTIDEINIVARERFMETFSRVEGNFVSLFARLFGGGEAALMLDEGDPLEAGIKIYASPKGKKLNVIDLLSGGEKAMTAISLLFALYLERPAPFCFLDEVDALLDDVNVVRFNRMLREFTDRTQFLVVTHNKLTMERSDRLYGVTMQEEGISRLVGVDLGKRDAEKVET